MKKLFVVGVLAAMSAANVQAADLYRKAPAAAPVTNYNWTGCYIGAEAGYSSGREPVISATGSNIGARVATVNPDGGIGGGTIGCNWQSSNIVFGIENDISASGLSDSAGVQAPFNTAFSRDVSTSWLDTLRGRIGLAWDRALFYATAGAAFTNIKDTASGGGVVTAASTNRTGWTAGAGVEYLLAPQWSTKLEYLYADFGTVHDAFDVSSGGFFVGNNTHLTENIVRVGLNYRFK